MSVATRLTALQLAILALAISATVQFLCFACWPGTPMQDLGYSIFAAQNLLAHGHLQSLNPLADYHDNLAPFANPRFMVHWPPGQSLLYAAAMSLGLEAGAATKALGLIGILAGGLGWIFLARFLGASRNGAAVVAVVYPWMPLAADVYRLYETEQVALALMPWFCLALLRIDPAASAAPARDQARRLCLVILLAVLLIVVKYSMVPVFLAAALYLVLQDGRRFAARGIWWKAGVLSLLVFPPFLFALVNHLYGARLPVPAVEGHQAAWQFVRNIFNVSIAGTLGWRGVARHLHAFPGLVDLLSLVSLIILVLHVRRFPPRGRVRSFAILLGLLTAALWLSLGASTYLGNEQWDFTADERLYLPITLLWLLCGAVSLDAMPARDLVRSPALYALAVPIFLTAAIGLRTAVLPVAYPAMPNTGIAWTMSREPDHAAFLTRFAASRGRKPDLLIALSSVMDELEVPSFTNGFAMPPGRHYWSGEPLEVWALVIPSQEKTLLADFSGASVQRVATPPRYPYIFYIFKLGPAKTN